MTQEKLEHEIKVLEEAIHLYVQSGGMDTSMAFFLKDKIDDLEAIKKPKFRDGTLGKCNAFNNIVVYRDVLGAEMGDFYPLPIETILRHLAPEGAVRWKYWAENSIIFHDSGNNIIRDKTQDTFNIPAPYREDWTGIGGTL